ncbi:hypothetical protein GCM10008917_19990 [Paraclostridium tenue]|uniref:Uncharacterized protein n=1 Tax=Paraclostridium tenue TaxID=1737 RepID=A0ABP3XJJ8_9FIRM
MLYLAYSAQHVLMLSFFNICEKQTFTSIQTKIEKGKNTINCLTLKKWGEIKNEHFKKKKVYYAKYTYYNIFTNSSNGTSYLDSTKWKF